MTRLHTLKSLSAAMAVLVMAAGETAFSQEAPKPSTFWGTETAEAAQLTQQYAAKKGTMGQAQHAMIAACHSRSVDIGLDILRQGGNATDAFIAVTFADYVQSPGASSLGGPLGVLVYRAEDQKVDSLVAPLKTVQSPTGQWRSGDTAQGKQVLIPGALAGLEALHTKYGKLPWRDLVTPAANLARDGFTVDYMYAAIVSAYAATIKHSPYGAATYFHADGTPVTAGETLKLPVIADTLDAIAAKGAGYMYTGSWAVEAVRSLTAEGGEMTLKDLADYKPEWSQPLHIVYRGRDIYALSGHNSGGARLLLALKVLQHTDITAIGHYSESLDSLETMIRISRVVTTEPSLGAQSFFDDPPSLADPAGWTSRRWPVAGRHQQDGSYLSPATGFAQL